MKSFSPPAMGVSFFISLLLHAVIFQYYQVNTVQAKAITPTDSSKNINIQLASYKKETISSETKPVLSELVPELKPKVKPKVKLEKLKQEKQQIAEEQVQEPIIKQSLTERLTPKEVIPKLATPKKVVIKKIITKQEIKPMVDKKIPKPVVKKPVVKKPVVKKQKVKKVKLKKKIIKKSELKSKPKVKVKPKSKPKKMAKSKQKQEIKKINKLNEISPSATKSELVTSKEQEIISRQNEMRQLNKKLKTQYQAVLLNHIEQFKKYPKSARKRGIQGKVRVTFELHKNGQIKNLKLASGQSILTKTTHRAVNAALPLPIYPNEGKLPMTFSFYMEYRLR